MKALQIASACRSGVYADPATRIGFIGARAFYCVCGTLAFFVSTSGKSSGLRVPDDPPLPVDQDPQEYIRTQTAELEENGRDFLHLVAERRRALPTA